MMKIKQHSVNLDSGEVAHAAYCIGIAINVFRRENFDQGKTVLTDDSIKELVRLQEKLECVH